MRARSRVDIIWRFIDTRSWAPRLRVSIDARSCFGTPSEIRQLSDTRIALVFSNGHSVNRASTWMSAPMVVARRARPWG